MKPKATLILILSAAAVLAFVSLNQKIADPGPRDLDESPDNKQTGTPQIEVIASGLNIPWDVDFLPSGEILITERPGNLLTVGKDKQVIKVEGVRHIGEGGLMGLAVHPDVQENNWIYLYLTSQSGSSITNRVERYKLEDNKLSDRLVILEGIAGSSVHDGGQIEFGPDNFLYITTGDAGSPDSAQDKNSLNGKILRVADDGSIPSDNPFGSAVYSYGHRNPQGLAWDDAGNLWAAEHGPSGRETGNDELNLIEKGKNYGWPIIRGAEKQAGMETPVIESGRSETWAPSGLGFFQGRLWMAGLRGETLYGFDPMSQALERYLVGQYGRLRAVKAGNKGLYITTSNRDGRGSPDNGDDRLILISDSGIFKIDK